jgi:hypothetical protein
MATPRPELVDSVIQQESGGNPNAVSPKGATGLMQIMPDTARDYGVDPAQLTDPKVNRDTGTKILGDLIDKYGGDERQALIAYNQGQGKLDSGRVVPGASEYASNVLAGAAGRNDDPAQAEQAFTARKSDDQLAAIGMRYLQDHPERAAALGAVPAAPAADATVGMKPPTSPAEAESQQKAIEGVGGSEAQNPAIDPTFVAADIASGGLTGGIAAGLKAGASSAAYQEASNLAMKATGSALPNHPYVQAIAGLVLPFILQKGLAAGVKGGAQAAEGAAPAAEEAAAEAAPAAEAATPAEPASAAASSPTAEGNGAAANVAPPMAEPAASVPVPPESATPAAAAQTLAQRQADLFKQLQVGEGGAAEVGRPDLATRIPEADTLAKAKSMGLDFDRLKAEAMNEPEQVTRMAAHVQAVYGEATDLRASAADILKRQAAGEDVSTEMQAWLNRVDALAPQAARVAGARSAAGRTLQILDPLKYPETQMASAVNRFALESSDPQTAQDLMQMFLSKTDPGAIARQLGEMSNTIEKGGSIKGAVGEYYMNALLSKPRTTVKKGLGDLTSMALSVPTRAIAARLPGATVQPGEATAMVQGAIGGFGDALGVAAKTWRDETSAFDQLTGAEGAFDHPMPKGITSEGTRFEDTPIGKGIDALGSVIRLPSRGISAVHDFSRMINYRMELHALAFRQAMREAAEQGASGGAAGDFISQRMSDLIGNPTSELTENARTFANAQTYSAPLGPIMSSVNDTLDKLPLGLGRLAFPFRRVPVNLFKYAVGHSPLALLSKTFWGAMQAGGAERDIAMAKLGLGTLASLQIGKWAADGHITGGGESDPTLRRDRMATGWQPYSIRVGDKYYSYESLEPISTPLGIIADFHDLMAQAPAGDAEHIATALSMALGRNMTRQSYVQTFVNLGSLMDDISQGKDMAGNLSNFAGKEISGLIPSALQGEAKREDPIMRETKGLIDQLKSRTPGYSESLPPRRDLYGRPMAVPGGFMANEVYPFRLGSEQHDPIANEIYSTGADVTKVPTILPGTGRAPKWGDAPDNPDVGVNLTPQERDRWQVLRGSFKDPDSGTLHDALTEVINDPDYKDAPQDAKKAALERVIAGYSHAASGQLLAESKDLQQRYAQRLKYKALAKGGDPNDVDVSMEMP